jgi:hypothetical protein
MNMNIGQTFSALQGNPTADALVQAAAHRATTDATASVPARRAYKAIEEGDTDRARQIGKRSALQNNARDSVRQRIDFRELAKKAGGCSPRRDSPDSGTTSD